MRSIGLARFIVAFTALAITADGQDHARPEFEVAMVRPVDLSTLGDAISMNLGTVRREEVTFGNATLNDCIRFAYNMASDAQIAGPDWIKSKQFLYDVVAKGTPGASREELQAMMQTLLAERFKLVTHREQRDVVFRVGACKKRAEDEASNCCSRWIPRHQLRRTDQQHPSDAGAGLLTFPLRDRTADHR